MTSVDVLQMQLQSARKSILFMETQHASTLQGLHAEIHQLQKKCSGMMFELAMRGEVTKSDDSDLNNVEILKCEVSELTKKKISLTQQLELREKQLVELEEHALLQERKYLNEIKAQKTKISELTIESDSRANAVGYLSVQLHQARSKLHSISLKQKKTEFSHSPTPPTKPKTPKTVPVHHKELLKNTNSDEVLATTSGSRVNRSRFSLSSQNASTGRMRSRPLSASSSYPGRNSIGVETVHSRPSTQYKMHLDSNAILYADCEPNSEKPVIPKPLGLSVLPPINKRSTISKDRNANSVNGDDISSPWLHSNMPSECQSLYSAAKYDSRYRQTEQIAVKRVGNTLTPDLEVTESRIQQL